MVRQASGTTAQPNGRTPTKEHKPSTSLPLTDRHSGPAHVPRGSQHRHGRKVAPPGQEPRLLITSSPSPTATLSPPLLGPTATSHLTWRLLTTKHTHLCWGPMPSPQCRSDVAGWVGCTVHKLVTSPPPINTCPPQPHALLTPFRLSALPRRRRRPWWPLQLGRPLKTHQLQQEEHTDHVGGGDVAVLGMGNREPLDRQGGER